MPIPSVPIVLDKEYRLRFSQPDLLAIEEKVGPIFTLFSADKMGFGVARVLVWRGLYQETQAGELVHVFPMSPKGMEQAGEFILKYIHEDGGSFPELFDKLAPGFGAALGFDRTKKTGWGESSGEGGPDPKNP